MSASSRAQFIEEIGALIRAEAIRREYRVCSPIIAQAIVESRYGESGLAKYHNYFGLKCGSSWRGASVNMRTKEEYQVGVLTDISAFFRAYPNMEEGVCGYFDFISTKRYANLKTADNPNLYLTRIKADGYATSSAYVATCMKYVTTHNLTRFDEGMNTMPAVGNPYHMPERTLKNGSTGNGVRWLQYELNIRGYQLVVDGIFGQKTEDAVRDYQNSRMLICDGIVGPVTRTELLSGR